MCGDGEKEGGADDSEDAAEALKRLLVAEAFELRKELYGADEAESTREAKETDENGALDRAVLEETQHRVEWEGARKIGPEPAMHVVDCNGAKVTDYHPVFLRGRDEGDGDINHKDDIDQEVSNLQRRVTVAAQYAIKCKRIGDFKGAIKKQL